VSTRSTLLYTLATQRRTLAGVPLPGSDQNINQALQSETIDQRPVGGELRLDGRMYQGLGSARFAIQDHSGLIGINTPGEPVLRALQQLGVNAFTAKQLQERLLDYIDEGDFARLNGAEKNAYLNNDQAPPPNRRLLSPQELLRVLGWEQSLDIGAIVGHLTPHPIHINVNTSSLFVLQAKTGGSEKALQQLLRTRQDNPFNSMAAVNRVAGEAVIVSPETIRFISSRFLRVYLWQDGADFGSWTEVVMTPFGEQHPWYIEYEIVGQLTNYVDTDATAENVRSDLFTAF